MIGRRAFVHVAAAVRMTRLLGVPSAEAESPSGDDDASEHAAVALRASQFSS
jgi:hypothetical protein